MKIFQCQQNPTECSYKEHFLYYYPWEKISIYEDYELQEGSYYVYIVSQGILNKEIRIIDPNSDKINNVVLEIFIEQDSKQIKFIKTTKQQENHLFFTAWQNLLKDDWLGFATNAQLYLYKQTDFSNEAMLLRYYLAQYYKHKKEYVKACDLCIDCLRLQPLMAEFWCILADCCFLQKQWLRAKRLYENAVFLGSKRKTDLYFIELEKYTDYPQKRITAINSRLNNIEI